MGLSRFTKFPKLGKGWRFSTETINVSKFALPRLPCSRYLNFKLCLIAWYFRTNLYFRNHTGRLLNYLLNSQTSPWTIYHPPCRPFGLLCFAANSTHISIQPTTSTPWRPTILLICPAWMKWIERMSSRTAPANKMSRLLAVPCRSVLSIRELAICCC